MASGAGASVTRVVIGSGTFGAFAPGGMDVLGSACRIGGSDRKYATTASASSSVSARNEPYGIC